MVAKNKTHTHTPPSPCNSTVSNEIFMKLLFLRANGQDVSTEKVSLLSPGTRNRKSSIKPNVTLTQYNHLIHTRINKSMSIRMRQTAASPRQKHHFLTSNLF